MAITTGGRAFVESLKQEGVEYVFGLPGSTDLLFLDALEDYPEIKYILGLHESVALGMAEGYARVSGKAGVVNLHGSAGLAAAMPMLYDACLGGVPLVVTVGDQDPRLSDKDPAFNPTGPAQHYTKWSTEITRAADIPRAIQEAFRTALQPPAGPVCVSFQPDSMGDAPYTQNSQARPLVTQSYPGNKAISAAADRPAGAESLTTPATGEAAKKAFQEREAVQGVISQLLHELKDQIKPKAMTRLLQELKNQIKPGTIIIEEAPSYAADVQRFLDSKEPLSYFHGQAGGSIGGGLPNALGAKLAAPGRPVVGIIGDGSAIWSIQSLWTAAHYHLPATFLVIANGSYRVLKLMKLKQMGKKSAGRYLGLNFDQPRLDFCQIARSMGIAGRKVDRPDEIREALKTALQGGAPYLLEVNLKDEQ
jgi:thiamine pyrophosphate-dependent acetolactate synthase large subunit-like protein